jgi:glycosyltransferase involved in cell wall biosynthesis
MVDWPMYRRKLAENGVAHQHIDFFDRDSAVFWKSVQELSKLVSKFQPDVVHCHSGVAACAASAVRDTNEDGFRLIGQLHSWGTDRPEWMNTMDISGFIRSDLVIANAAAYRRILIKGGVARDKIVSIPWGVAPEAMMKLPNLDRRKSGRIGFVGRVERRKGQLELVRAFDHVRHIYRRERNWDLFVSLSSDEGQGMAILEAMAIGVPVLARNCAGVEDYLRDGQNAIALKSNATRDVANTIEWALDHPDKTSKLSLQARKMVEVKYPWNKTVQAMETVYGIWEAR